MPTETIVVHKGHGLPYSKGLMAQSISATGLSHERAFDLARMVETRLAERGALEIDTEALHAAERGARVVFLRNRPVGVDDALMELASAA